MVVYNSKGTSARSLNIWIIANCDIQYSGRVQRLASGLSGVGHCVSCFTSSATKEEIVVDVGDTHLFLTPHINSFKSRIWSLGMRWLSALSSVLFFSIWKFFYKRQTNLNLIETSLFEQLRQKDPSKIPDLVIAHHWSTLPLARRIVEETNCKLIYDENEHSIGEHKGNGFLRWPLGILSKKIVSTFAPSANLIISPCVEYLEAIKVFLHEKNDRAEYVEIRNCIIASKVIDQLYKGKKDRVNVCFQGLNLRNRSLDKILKSSASWPNNAHLLLQILGNARDQQSLEAHIATLPNRDRIQIIPPVPASQMVDNFVKYKISIGLCCFEKNNLQVAYSLPNKLFAFLSAGVFVLAVEATASGNMLVKHGLAKPIEDFTPEEISDAIRHLYSEPKLLEQKRLTSLNYAKKNTWETEIQKLLNAISELAQ